MADESMTMRRCIGSARFGIEPHESPVSDFPAQASQKDGLGRMCRTHWNQYTAGLARDAKARKAASATSVDASAPATTSPRKRRTKAIKPEPGAQGDAG